MSINYFFCSVDRVVVEIARHFASLCKKKQQRTNKSKEKQIEVCCNRSLSVFTNTKNPFNDGMRIIRYLRESFSTSKRIKTPNNNKLAVVLSKGGKCWPIHFILRI